MQQRMPERESAARQPPHSKNPQDYLKPILAKEPDRVKGINAKAQPGNRRTRHGRDGQASRGKQSFCRPRSGRALGDQMRSYDTNQLAGRDDFSFFPELRGMTLVTGYEIVRAGGIGALEEDIVAGVGRDLKRAGGKDEIGPVFNELKKLTTKSSADVQFRARQDGPILRNAWRRYVQAGRLRDGKQQNGALQTIRLEGRRNHDVRVEDQAKREHERLILGARFLGLPLSALRVSGLRLSGSDLLNDAVNLA